MSGINGAYTSGDCHRLAVMLLLCWLPSSVAVLCLLPILSTSQIHSQCHELLQHQKLVSQLAEPLSPACLLGLCMSAARRMTASHAAGSCLHRCMSRRTTSTTSFIRGTTTRCLLDFQTELLFIRASFLPAITTFSLVEQRMVILSGTQYRTSHLTILAVGTVDML